jgi:acyl-CoA thioesterase
MVPGRLPALAAATVLQRDGEGAFRVELSPDWWLADTAFGGYLAAIALRSCMESRPDRDHQALSLAVHFLGETEPGTAEISALTEGHSSGGSTVSARLSQHGRCVATATAAFGRLRPGPELHSAAFPPVPSANACEALVVRPEVLATYPLGRRFERRRLPRATEGQPAAWDTGGWIRLAEPSPTDSLAAVVLLDAWPPAVSAKLSGRIRMTTVSYFVQFNGDALQRPSDGMDEMAYYLSVFRGDWASHGYAADDGELWSAGGRLLAQSRQVVLVAPKKPGSAR